MAQFHDRMPAILEEQDFDDWLKGTVGKVALLPAPENLLRSGWRRSA